MCYVCMYVCMYLTFVDLNITIKKGQISTKSYGFNFSMVRLPYKYSNIPSKIFYPTISAEIFQVFMDS